jgi:hypothetical protein
MNRRWTRFGVWGTLLLLLVQFGLSSTAAHAGQTEALNLVTEASGPTINIWYGSTQSFGQLGNPQKWINVLGNVSDPDGVASFVYALNGGAPSPLSIGTSDPESRRLAEPGDFNVEIDRAALAIGANQVVITATDTLANQSAATVMLQYAGGNVWPLPYSINWASVANLQDVVQIVDGQWAVQPGGARPVAMAYDRVLALGDLTWSNYEVTVPITVHATDSAAYNPISIGPGVGLVLRWREHSNSPVSCAQPHCGWLPWGASGWYNWAANDGAFYLGGDNVVLVYDTSLRKLQLGTPYVWKMRVDTPPGQRGYYRLKVWPQSQTEPEQWDLQALGGPSDVLTGSVLLVAHHVDATFGNVSIVPVSSGDTTAPLISDIQVARRAASATITWKTDEPATSLVDYGLTSAYGSASGPDSALVHQHTITLTALAPDTVYHFRVTSADPYGNLASSADLTFQTTRAATLVADDFNACTINTQVWSFADPQLQAALALNGGYTSEARLSLSIPAGVSHDVWAGGNLAPRLMQWSSDNDFTILVKFDSPLNAKYQRQGVVVEQGNGDFLRFDFFTNGVNTRAYAGFYYNGKINQRLNKSVGGLILAPLYLRVERQGDVWTLSHSPNGQDWTMVGSFTQPLAVTRVGVFAGNAADAGETPPAHTALVDFFAVASTPPPDEDSEQQSLTVNIEGSGAVTKSPDLANYTCGQEVTLTATADPGFRFLEWSGDLSGSANPVSLTMMGSQTITATFVNGSIFLPLVMRGGP